MNKIFNKTSNHKQKIKISNHSDRNLFNPKNDNKKFYNNHFFSLF